ncbi:MAG: hypothetical protein M0R03_22635, partial [Novosphingobium sp.]|nr:hypothetical protein [Novosphingobium sp.]
MANKNFAPSMTFTESEKRLPKTESAGATRTGVILTANSGYGNIPINIRTETQLIDMFGYPTETNYKMWFDCAGYLKYASELYVIRPVIDATWANYGIGIDPSENVTSVNKTNMYNPDIAEATLDTATVTSANKIEFYNKSISTNDDIAVLVCSKEADFTSPIVDEDAVLLHSTYIHADTPVIDASEGTATIATVANTVLTHGYSIIAEDPSDLETYYVYRYNANTTAWVQGDAIATTALIFTDEKSAVLTVTNRKKFGNLAWSNTEVTEVGGAGTFTHLDPQPKSYKKIKNTTTNFISYVVPHYLATSLYNSSTGLATTYENLIKPEPDFGAYELGVIVL